MVKRSFIFMVLILTILNLGHLPVHSENDSMEQQVTALLNRCESENTAVFWNAVQDLNGLGNPAVATITTLMPTLSSQKKLAAANALVLLGQEKFASNTFIDVLNDLNSNQTTQLLAVHSLNKISANLKKTDRILAAITALNSRNIDPLVTIAILEWQYTSSQDATVKEKLQLHLKDKQLNARFAAALALANVGDFDGTLTVFQEIAKEPSVRGIQAKQLLLTAGLLREFQTQNSELLLALNAKPGQQKPYEKLIEEVVNKIQLHYVESGDKTETDQLVNTALKGMVQSLDPFSRYEDEEDITRASQQTDRTYKGIGIRVSIRPKDGRLIVTQPIYSGPAYKAGLQSGDIITKVEEVDIANMTLQEIVKLIKGPDNTSVNITVFRKGWAKARVFAVKRATIHMNDVLYRMLPGKIGYVHQLVFGKNTSVRVKAALEDLKAQGMQGLIYDLRNNGGGWVNEVIKIAGYLMGKGKPILAMRGRDGKEIESHLSNTKQITDVPMVFLVNDYSASGSEALSGAGRDHGRGKLIGVKTFGKGSAQRMYYLQSTQQKTRLRLTYAKYYLPSGLSPHEVGLEPDILVEQHVWPYWTIPEIEKIKSDEHIVNYVRNSFDVADTTMKRIAETDHGLFTLYPEFDSFYDSLKTKLEKSQVRSLIRRQVRRIVEDKQGKEFALDLQEDTQLQKSIMVILEEMGTAINSIEDYKDFAK